jgi:hypothetical protein
MVSETSKLVLRAVITTNLHNTRLITVNDRSGLNMTTQAQQQKKL